MRPTPISQVLRLISRINFPFFLCFLFLFSFSCTPKKQEEKSAAVDTVKTVSEKDNFEAGVLYPSVSLRANPSESFALYLPHEYDSSRKFPALIFFDPHGDGSFPIGKYKALADSFGCVLMGSNNSKNGLNFDETNRIADALIAEASMRFSVDAKMISLAGFSGGAKVVLVAAMSHPELLSVVYCGAAIPPEQVHPVSPALGFAGKRDMNYTEVIAMDNSLEKLNSAHCLIEWSGKHEWTDSTVFKNAFWWTMFQAMKKGVLQKDDSSIRKFLKENSKTSNDVLAEELQLRKVIAFGKDLADVSPYEKRRNEIIQSSAYKRAIADKEQSLEIENRMKQNYVQCFDEKDLNWWNGEIIRMQKIKNSNEHEMYARLLSYLSLASYSMSNSAIRQGNAESAQKILAIYKLVDPENTDRPFLEACLFARQGNNEQAISSLKEAVRLGLKDKVKVMNEESFAQLKGTNEFQELVNGM